MPKTRLGKWAGGLMVVFIVFLAAIIVGRNQSGIPPGTPFMIVAGICAMIAGIGAFVTGVVSLTKYKDRSTVVIVATIFGFVALLIVIMEVVEGIVWRVTH